MASHNENPTFVVFVHFRDISFPKSLSHALGKLDITSTFYAVFPTSVALICAPCRENNNHRRLTESELFSNSVWKKIHVENNHLKLGDAFGKAWEVVELNPLTFCDISIPRFLQWRFPPAKMCLLRNFASTYNISYSPRSEATGVAKYFLMSKSNVEEFLLVNGNTRFEPFGYGMYIEDIRIATLVRAGNHGINTLTEPFDAYIWSLLMCSLVCLCLYFRLNGNSKVGEVHVVSILLEQSQPLITHPNHRKILKQTYWLLTAWFLLTFLVGNAYKGVLFSLLTLSNLPPVAESLTALVSSGIYIGTMRKFSKYTTDSKGIETRVFIPTVHYHVGNLVKTSMEVPDLESYLRLNSSLNSFVTDVSHRFVAKATHSEIEGFGKNHTLPEEFALVDTETLLNQFTELNNMLSQNFVVILGPTLNLFAVRYQWIIQRNSMLRLMLPFLYGIEESGIFSRWEDFQRIWDSYEHLNYSDHMLKNRESRMKDNILAYLLFKPYTMKSPSVAKPITVGFFSVFAVLFGYCIAICGGVFILEWVSGWKPLRSCLRCKNRLFRAWFLEKFGYC